MVRYIISPFSLHIPMSKCFNRYLRWTVQDQLLISRTITHLKNTVHSSKANLPEMSEKLSVFLLILLQAKFSEKKDLKSYKIHKFFFRTIRILENCLKTKICLIYVTYNGTHPSFGSLWIQLRNLVQMGYVVFI